MDTTHNCLVMGGLVQTKRATRAGRPFCLYQLLPFGWDRWALLWSALRAIALLREIAIALLRVVAIALLRVVAVALLLVRLLISCIARV